MRTCPCHYHLSQLRNCGTFWVELSTPSVGNIVPELPCFFPLPFTELFNSTKSSAKTKVVVWRPSGPTPEPWRSSVWTEQQLRPWIVLLNPDQHVNHQRFHSIESDPCYAVLIDAPDQLHDVPVKAPLPKNTQKVLMQCRVESLHKVHKYHG